MSVKVVPTVKGKRELYFFSTQRPIITILILILALLLINRAVAELPDLLLCEMANWYWANWSRFFSFVPVVFHVTAKRTLCTLRSPLGLDFVSGRSWKSISLDPVRDGFDHVPVEMSLSGYEDTSFNSVSLLLWLGVRGSSFTLDALAGVSDVCTRTTTPDWTETFWK